MRFVGTIAIVRAMMLGETNRGSRHEHAKKRIVQMRRTVAWLFCTGTAALLGLQAYLISDLESFEWKCLFEMVGGGGVALALLLNTGLVAISWRLFRRRPLLPRGSVIWAVFLIAWGIGFLWVCDWIYLRRPVSLRLSSWFARESNDGGSGAESAGRELDGFGHIAKPVDLQIMVERIRLNRPDIYLRNDVLETIWKYSRKYDVDPVLIFYLNYIDSFYGNAPAGPLPFFHDLTAETFRDLIQVHLPTWVVESGWRKELAETKIFRRVLGPNLGMKLNYFAHKFTLDASVAPYALNVFSDVLLVLREYPEQFPELQSGASGDDLGVALRESFRAIASTALIPPYEVPYSTAPYDEKYYDSQRGNLKRYARAVFYKLLFDFDFSTRVQVLLAKYYESVVNEALGDEVWTSLAPFQRQAILAMPRDLFVPNVGKMAYNVYALPELNCTTIGFVADEAKIDSAVISPSKTWVPRDPDKLWAGAGYRLRVFSEVWSVIRGTSFPGIKSTTTVSDAHWLLRASNHNRRRVH